MPESLVKIGLSIKEVLALPGFTKDSISEAEAKEALNAMARQVAEDSNSFRHLRQALLAKIKKPEPPEPLIDLQSLQKDNPLVEEHMTLAEAYALPAFSKEFVSEAEVKEALQALGPHIGWSSPGLKRMQEILEAKVEKTAAKAKRTIKSVLTGGSKGKSSKKKKD